MRIRTKLYLVAGLTVIGFACIFAISNYGKLKVSDVVGELLLAKNVKIDMLEARRAEKNFLTRKDVSYVDLLQAAMERANADLGSMSSDTGEIRGLLKEYVQAFSAVVENMKRQGLTEKEGLTGDLRTSIHEVESVLDKQDDDALKAMMLMLRRREKDFMLRDDVKYVDLFQTDMKRMREAVASSEQLTADSRTQIAKLLTGYEGSFQEYVRAAAIIRDKEKKLREVVRKIEPYLDEIVQQAERRFLEVEETSSYQVAAGVGAFASFSLVLLIFVVRGIQLSLTQMGEMSRKVAGGELDACHAVRFGGELETLRMDIANMVDLLKAQMSLAEEKNTEATRQAERAQALAQASEEEKQRSQSMLEIMTEVAVQALEISKNLAASSDELRQRIAEVAQGTQSQRNLVQETATAMEEMNATVLEVARNASDAARGAENAKLGAENGAGIVKQVGHAAGQAEQQTETMRGGLQELGERAEAIGRIMDMITDIADQTNLLALNAAIEAARAGDAGRGFAVVADEVRKLAEKTMAATREVDVVIQGIQEGTRQSVIAMDGTGQSVSISADLAKKAEFSLNEIVAIIGSTTLQVDSIASAAEQQSATSREITKATEEINRISGNNALSLDEVVQGIRHVADLAANLRTVMEKLRH